MENHHHVDKLSQLPQPILHRILSPLSQTDAVRTSVLSKSWRYIWLARPNLEFRQPDFPRSSSNRTTFMSVVDTALQMCHDQDLTTQDFFLEMFGFDIDDSESTRLLSKWISIVLQNKGLKTFRLQFLSKRVLGADFQNLPPILLKSQSLRELHLQGCKLTIFSNTLLENLQTLSLTRVLVTKETLEIVFSSCPLLENVSLLGCEGSKTINTSSITRLKHLAIEGSTNTRQTDTISIEIENPTVETITIVACQFHNHHQNNYLPNLKSLALTIVRLSNESFDFFSSTHMPRLNCLTLDSCNGFDSVDLRLSDTVEHLTIRNPRGGYFTKAAIDAPNIVTFVYEVGKINLQSGPVSFATSSVGWGSNISVRFHDNFNNDPTSWFGKVNEQLGALSGSRISLELCRVEKTEEVIYGRRNRPRGFIDENQRQAALYESLPNILFCGRDYEPVVVEHLSLRGCYTHSSLAAFLYCLFRICHPSYVGQDLFSNEQGDGERDDKELTLLLYLILIMEREMREHFWPGGLDDVKMESFDEDNGQGSVVVKFRFRLQWSNRRSC